MKNYIINLIVNIFVRKIQFIWRYLRTLVLYLIVVFGFSSQALSEEKASYFDPDGGVISTAADLRRLCNAEQFSTDWWTCAGYVLGGFRAHLVASWINGEKAPFCLPRRLSNNDIIVRVTAYLNERPAQLKDPEKGMQLGAALVLMMALEGEFPCPDETG